MGRERRPASFLRGVLLFVLGGLVGANATYFALTREGGPGAQPARGDDRIQAPLPIEVTPGAKPDATPQPPMLPPPAVRATGTGPSPGPMQAPEGDALLIPVQGITAAQLQDTFSDSRSNSRVHDAIDIMAPAGTPVLAVADGTVEKLFDSKLGGTTLYQFNPQRTRAYYYAHLQGYAPGIAEKQALRRGQVLGYVGATGNASADAPHLHFAIFELGPEQQWWKGTAINPYPALHGSP
ncbi:MAG: M23 family metallopeptidase [Lysobacteraceae bacterium]|nr:MAG: M23 family metallopeptidase [Xanthomonadaceae bacterium]